MFTIDRLKLFISIACLCVLVTACGGGGGGSNDVPPTADDEVEGDGSSNETPPTVDDEVEGGSSSSNAPPTVDAGTDQTVNHTQESSVSLMATVSDDGLPVIRWVQLSGTPVILSSTSTADTSFLTTGVFNVDPLVFEVTVDDGTNAAVSDTVSVTVISAWMLNPVGLRSTSFMELDSPLGVIVNVLSEKLQTVDTDDYVSIETRGIPNYVITPTQEFIDSVNNHPLAATAFITGSSNLSPGFNVSFGSDIGYNSSNLNCNLYGGFGFWPPGYDCPIELAKTAFFPVSPTVAATACEVGQGVIGLWVNGVSLYGWSSDGASYDANSWFNLAPVAEQFDVDICGGHADQGEYIHHAYSSCLATTLGDDGSVHSPIYGFAADGYPIYGPYESNGTLAISAWMVRDYGDAVSDGGCGTPGLRTCVLIDEYDLSAGVDTSVTQGPNIGETVTTLFDNTLNADIGYYLEDYYFAAKAATGQQLDQHNGHDNNDSRGYHYHTTVTDDGSGKLVPAFPYTVGPRFYGALEANALTTCGADGS